MRSALVAMICLFLALGPLAMGCKQSNGSSTRSGFSIGHTSPEAIQDVHKDLHGAEPFSIWTTDLEKYFKYGPPTKKDRLFGEVKPFSRMIKSDKWHRHFNKD